MTRSHSYKLLAYWLSFIVLHYAYNWLPNPVTAIFSGTNEAFIQHAKICFFAYTFVNLGEWLLCRPKININFIFARIWSSLLLPALMAIVWFSAPGFYGRLANDAVEAIFANIALLVSAICLFSLESVLENAPQTRLFRMIGTALWLLAGTLFILFTFRLPWVDVFAIPPGWD